MKKLTARLQAVADLVRPDVRVADIGTDHALLPVWLLQQGRCPAAVASDIGEGPVMSARHTVGAAGLTEQIVVRQGDGLSSVAPDEVEDIVIAGMGGETIAAILDAAPWVQNPRYHLVLQPMSKPERLRRFLFQNGFFIYRETVVAEEERLYLVMSVAFTGKTQSTALSDCVVGQIPHTPEGRRYMEKQRGRIAEALSGCEKNDTSAVRRVELAAALAHLDRWMEST